MVASRFGVLGALLLCACGSSGGSGFSSDAGSSSDGSKSGDATTGGDDGGTLFGDGGADFVFKGPEANVVCGVAAKNDGERGAPCACANHGDAAHALPSVGLFAGKRFSVPAKRR